MVKVDTVSTALEETNRTLAYHGGRLAAARRRFPEAPEPWLDLSTGINALPYPVGALSAAAFSRLPEASSIAALEAAAARAFGLGGAGGRRGAGHAKPDPDPAAPVARAKSRDPRLYLCRA